MERAFDLILRFERDDLVASVLETSYWPLIRSGQTATLSAFASSVRSAPAQPPAVVDLAEAEIALADGSFELASRVALRAIARLPTRHELLPRAHTLVAEAAYARAFLKEAELAYQAAFEAAESEEAQVEALRGWALSSLQGETSAPAWVMERLEKRPRATRRWTSSVTPSSNSSLRFFTNRLRADSATLVAEAKTALCRVDDPRARSSFAHVAAYIGGSGVYGNGEAMARAVRRREIAAFDLDFARPHSLWNHAHLALGRRKFGAAERALQKLEDSVVNHPLDYHVVNARILRGRLALQTGKVGAALSALPSLRRGSCNPVDSRRIPHHPRPRARREGRTPRSDRRGCSAEEVTKAIKMRVLAAATRAVASGRRIPRAALLDTWEPRRPCRLGNRSSPRSGLHRRLQRDSRRNRFCGTNSQTCTREQTILAWLVGGD